MQPDPPFDGKAFVANLSSAPGVYRMLGEAGDLLYVGKAGNLKKRVGSYFLKPRMEPRIAAMVAQIARIETTLTRTEAEALLLEAQLIKTLRPRYNILLRDDKSYPYIHLTPGDYPRLAFHRGARSGGGRYFGPYPSAIAVRETLSLLQKLFRIRNCEDSYFKNRSRPCLQHQIGRCSAPCVDFISAEDYQTSVRHAAMFLEGKSNALLDELIGQMEAGQRQARLRARRPHARSHRRGEEDPGPPLRAWRGARHGRAGLRDRQRHRLRQRDVLPQRQQPRLARLLPAPGPRCRRGDRARFVPRPVLPRTPGARGDRSSATPRKTSTSSARRWPRMPDHKVEIKTSVRTDRARFLDMARTNAAAALSARLASRQTLLARFEALRDLLGLEEVPQRIECFDISHTMGEATVASCVVFGAEGPEKSQYRRFNIEGITGGDDYAAMHQALERRYRRIQAGRGPPAGHPAHRRRTRPGASGDRRARHPRRRRGTGGRRGQGRGAQGRA